MLRIAAASAHFGRDLEFDLQRVAKLIADARLEGPACSSCPTRPWAATSPTCAIPTPARCRPLSIRTTH